MEFIALYKFVETGTNNEVGYGPLPIGPHADQTTALAFAGHATLVDAAAHIASGGRGGLTYVTHAVNQA